MLFGPKEVFRVGLCLDSPAEGFCGALIGIV